MQPKTRLIHTPIPVSNSPFHKAFTVFFNVMKFWCALLKANRLYFSSHFLFSYGKGQVWTSSTMPSSCSMVFTSCLAAKACRGSFVTDSRILSFTGKGLPVAACVFCASAFCASSDALRALSSSSSFFLSRSFAATSSSKCPA